MAKILKIMVSVEGFEPSTNSLNLPLRFSSPFKTNVRGLDHVLVISDSSRMISTLARKKNISFC